jgi:hypothetical protein
LLKVLRIQNKREMGAPEEPGLLVWVCKTQRTLTARQEKLYAPRGADAERQHEGDAHQPSCIVALAPGLEHGNHSNYEQHDSGNREKLKPHISNLAS